MKDDNITALGILEVIPHFIYHDIVAMLDTGLHAHAIDLKAAYGCLEQEKYSQGGEDGDNDIADIFSHNSFNAILVVYYSRKGRLMLF